MTDLSTHPDWLALVRAVCATPDDDLPRLVAADFLDENGHGEYGEFIRVQCHLARGGQCESCGGHGLIGEDGRGGVGGVCCADCRGFGSVLEPLRRREWELGRAYCVHWFAPPPGFVVRWGPGADTSDEVRNGTPLYHVRRGFVSEVRAPLGVLLGGPCGRCNGEGRWRYYDPASDEMRRGAECSLCSGTGTTLGVLPRLVGRQPVEAVGVVGKEPEAVGRRFVWWETGTTPPVLDQPYYLPPAVRRLLPGTPPGTPLYGHRSHTRDAALAALSAAVLKRAGEVARELQEVPA